MRSFNLTNIFNFSGINLLIIFGAFLGFENEAADFAILIGSSYFFTQIFSSNSRNILIITYSDKNFFQRIYLRIKSSVLIFFLINIFSFFYFGDLIFKSILISIIIILQWINELYLLKIFQNKNKFKIKLFLLVNILFYLIIFFLFNNFSAKYIDFFLISYVIFIYFYIFGDLSEKKFFLKDFKSSFYSIFSKDISNFSFYSSFSMVFINFLSRIIILEFLSKDLCGILFACVSLGSIPGSIFNNSFGPYLVKNKVKIISKNYFSFFVIIFVSSIYLFYSNSFLIREYFSFSEFKYNTLYFCYLGSFFMITGLYFRQYLLFENKFNLIKIFSIDVLNSIFYLVIVIFVCYNNTQILFSLIFLIYSIYNFIIFFVYFLNHKYIKN